MLFNRTALGFIVGFSAVIALSFALMVFAGRQAADKETAARAASELESRR
ncbi:MAG: hypothetical protein Q8R39_00920 [bacterium]|nr:hypothetical protein [bacterium]